MASFNGSTRPFDDDGYDPRLASQRFNSMSHFDKDSGGDSPPLYSTVDDFFSPQPVTETPSPPPMYSSAGGYSAFSPDQNGEISDGDFGSSNGPVLPEMPPEDGSALREWRRQNAIRLAEKEMEEKEMLQQIIKEAEEYKAEFYRKRKIVCENNKVTNREKEKLYLENGEKFHAEAAKNYWKAIAELIPREVPAIEKRGKMKDEKKPSVVVIQGPKPGKPTDLSRMRQILGKLKNNPPLHMKSPPEPKKDATTDSSATAAVPSKAAAPVVAATPEALAAA